MRNLTYLDILKELDDVKWRLSPIFKRMRDKGMDINDKGVMEVIDDIMEDVLDNADLFT